MNDIHTTHVQKMNRKKFNTAFFQQLNQLLKNLALACSLLNNYTSLL